MQLGTEKNNTNIELVAWDLDKTIFIEHIHNWLTQQIVDQKTTPKGALNHFKSYKLDKQLFKDFSGLAKTMLDIGASGRKQAIVSFTDFPEIIRPALTYLLTEYMINDMFPEFNLENTLTASTHLKLNDSSNQRHYEEILRKITPLIKEIVDGFFIQTGYPTKDNGPVICAPVKMRAHNVGKTQHLQLAMTNFDVENPAHVLLIDDDPLNIFQAKQLGCHAIHVKQGSSYHLYQMQQLLKLPGFDALEEQPYQTQLYTPSTQYSTKDLILSSSEDSLSLEIEAKDQAYTSKYGASDLILSASEEEDEDSFSIHFNEQKRSIESNSPQDRGPILFAINRLSNAMNQLSVSNPELENLKTCDNRKKLVRSN